MNHQNRCRAQQDTAPKHHRIGQTPVPAPGRAVREIELGLLAGGVSMGTDTCRGGTEPRTPQLPHPPDHRRIRAAEPFGSDDLIDAGGEQPGRRLDQLGDPGPPALVHDPLRLGATFLAGGGPPFQSSSRWWPGDTRARPRSPPGSSPDSVSASLSCAPPGSTWQWLPPALVRFVTREAGGGHH